MNFAERRQTYIVELFSCEFCKVFKNTFFTEHLLNTSESQKIQEFNVIQVLFKPSSIFQRFD